MYYVWSKNKPKKWKECLLVTATWMNYGSEHYWHYSLFEIKQADGEDEQGNPAWYWGIFKDEDEWGDIADLEAQKYMMMPPLKNIKK